MLTDADIAAALGGTSEPASSAPGAAGPGTAPPADPFARGLAGGFHGAGDPAGTTEPASAPAFGGGAAPHDDDPDAADDGEGRRIGLLVAAGGLALVLVGGAVAGGIAWANRSRPAAPPEASGEDRAGARGDAAARVAPTASRSPRDGEPTGKPSGSSSPAPGPKGPGTPGQTTRPGPVDAPAGMAPAEARWFEVLTTLDQRRARAFATPDPDRLNAVYVAGSDLLAKDRAEIEKCVRAACRIDGLRLEITELHVVSAGRSWVDLEVVDQLQAYTVVEESGERTSQPAGEVKTRRITLVRGPAADWRIARIVAA